MADPTQLDIQQLTQALTTLNRNMQGGGSMGVGSDVFKSLNRLGDASNKTAMEIGRDMIVQQRNRRAIEDSQKSVLGLTYAIKKMQKSGVSYAEMAEVARAQMSKAVEQMSDKDLEAAFKNWKNKLDGSGSAYARQIAGNIKTHEEWVGIMTQDVSERVRIFEETKRMAAENKQHTEEYDNNLKKLNLKTEDLAQSTEEYAAAQKELTVATVAATEGQTTATDGVKKLGNAAKLVAVAIAKEFYTTAKSAAKLGGEMEYFDAYVRGLTPEQLMSLQKENRQLMQASGQTFERFNKQLDVGSSKLFDLTYSFEDTYRINASLAKQAKLLGANWDQYQAQEADRFKNLHDNFGMTAEEFVEVNTSLQENASAQQMLYKISLKQRAAYMAEVRATYDHLKVLGLSTEAAQAASEAMQAIGAQNPKDRLKQAAKLRAVGGALGMGADAEKASRLMMSGKTNTPEFADIMARMNKGVGDRMSQGFASELATMTMIQTTGLENILGPSSAFAKLNVDQNMQIGEIVKHTKTGNETLDEILNVLMHGTELTKTFFASGMGDILKLVIGGIMFKAVGGWIGKLLPGMLSKIMGGKAGGMFAGMSWKGVGKYAKSAGKYLKGPGVLGGVISGVSMIKDTYDRYNDPNAAQTTATDRVLGGLQGAASGALIGAVAGPVGAAVGAAVGGVFGTFKNDVADILSGKTNNINGGATSLSPSQQISNLTAKVDEIDKRRSEAADTTNITAEMLDQLKADALERKEYQRQIEEYNKLLVENGKKINDALGEQTDVMTKQHDESMKVGKKNRGYELTYQPTL